MKRELKKLYRDRVFDLVDKITEASLYSQQKAGRRPIFGADSVSANFKKVLPFQDYEAVQRIFKNLYKFSFISLKHPVKERAIELALTYDIEKLQKELGPGYAFVGRQYKIQLGDTVFFIDLLFYHTLLKRYIAIEIKNGIFKPDHVSKMNIYLTLVDEQLKKPGDKKSIGLILVAAKNDDLVSCSLNDSSRPIVVSEYIINSPS